MQQQVVLIHGGDAYSKHEDFLEALRTMPVRNLPEEINMPLWRDTLVTDLGETFEVFLPKMPNKENAHYEEWKLWFERHFEYLRDDAILIGWSLGGMFLAKYLSEEIIPFRIKAVLLLAAPYQTYDDGAGNDCGDFQFVINPAKLVQGGEIHFLHSKDDFVVPYAHAEAYKAALPEATLHTFEDKNHFLVEEFPEFITELQRLATK